MSDVNKLVIYTSDDELEKHAAEYPNLVNFNPFDKSGELDDGCGHYAHVSFIAMDPNGAPSFPEGDFGIVVFVGFPMPTFKGK